MEKQELIKILLKQGTQITSGALNTLTNDQELLSKILNSENLPSTITEEFLESQKPRTITSNSTVSTYNKILKSRYEFLKNIIEVNHTLPNLLSIKKITGKTNKFSIIGMISNLQNGLVLEDTTGSITFNENNVRNDLVEDEVIGVVALQHNGNFIIDEIIFPDIPLNKEIPTIKENNTHLFLSDIYVDSPQFNQNYYDNLLEWTKTQTNLTICLSGGISKTFNGFRKFLNDFHNHKIISTTTPNSDILTHQDPLLLKIENIKILLAEGQFYKKYEERWQKDPQTVLINLLKKRHFDPIFDFTKTHDNFLLLEIPDIIVVGNVLKPMQTTYKGRTILTNGSFLTKPVYWSINLKTRETFKTDFS